MSDIKTIYRDNIRFETSAIESLGGQSCGMPRVIQTLISDELGFKVSINCYRSMLKNRQLCITLFELALDDLIKEA